MTSKDKTRENTLTIREDAELPKEVTAEISVSDRVDHACGAVNLNNALDGQS